MGYEVAAQISQLIADFVTDIHSSTYIDIFLTVGQVWKQKLFSDSAVEGVPERLTDKVATLRRRAEFVSTVRHINTA